MGKFTTEVRSICESFSRSYEPFPTNDHGFTKVNTIIGQSRSHIFDFDYPCFDNNYKPILETKILRHFYTREICEETFGLWQLRLCDKMNLIMPYYNQLYESALLEINPLVDVNYTRTKTSTKSGKDTIGYTHDDTKTYGDTQTRTHNNYQIADNETINYGKTESNSGTITDNKNENKTTTYNTSVNDTINGTKWEKFSDTPQGSLSGIDNDTYLTNATKNTDNTSTTETKTGTETEGKTGANTQQNTENTTLGGTDTKNTTKTTTGSYADQHTGTVRNAGSNNREYIYGTTDNYIDTITGKRSTESYSKLLIDFRKTFLNIDKMIIEELNDLFFGLWE